MDNIVQTLKTLRSTLEGQIVKARKGEITLTEGYKAERGIAYLGSFSKSIHRAGLISKEEAQTFQA